MLRDAKIDEQETFEVYPQFGYEATEYFLADINTDGKVYEVVIGKYCDYREDCVDIAHESEHKSRFAALREIVGWRKNSEAPIPFSTYICQHYATQGTK